MLFALQQIMEKYNRVYHTDLYKEGSTKMFLKQAIADKERNTNHVRDN